MSLNKSLGKLIISRARLTLLDVFFSHPKDSFYIRELVRLTKEEINSIRRELENLKSAGVLTSEKRGNRVFYSVDAGFPFFQNLLALMAKVTGLGGKIVERRTLLGDIKFVIFSGHFLRWEDRKAEVDFLIVGKVVLPEIGKLVVEEEAERKREINYAVMDLNEFKIRKRSRDPFLTNILLNNPVVVLGDEQELARL